VRLLLENTPATILVIGLEKPSLLTWEQRCGEGEHVKKTYLVAACLAFINLLILVVIFNA
jgi:hypothetical protein